MQEPQAPRRIPGPMSARLMKVKQEELPQAAYPLTPTFAAEAHGAQAVDVDGNSYIDFAGGIGVLNVGHTHPKVVRAVVKSANLRTPAFTCSPTIRTSNWRRALTGWRRVLPRKRPF